MTKTRFLNLAIALTLFSSLETRMAAQESEPNIRVVVDMVQLNVAVTDVKGNYVTGLRPSDFAIVEDSIPQKLATFGEGNEPAYRVAPATSTGSTVLGRPEPGLDGSWRQRFPAL
jgi:Ca-activated chloride channel family protein